MKPIREFPETRIAAELLRQFFRATHPPEALEDANPVSTFFDKQYLTITEFLGPLGMEIRRAAPPRSRSVAAFFEGTLKTRQTPQAPLKETIRSFLSRL